MLASTLAAVQVAGAAVVAFKCCSIVHHGAGYRPSRYEQRSLYCSACEIAANIAHAQI